MGHSYVNLLVHIVFSTKDRVPFIEGEFKEKLHQYLVGIIQEQRGVPFIINGMPDHLHILTKFRQDQALSDFICKLKANSSKWARKINPNFEWQPGYGAFSVSESQVDRVYRYIANQEHHHRKISFQTEFETLLIRTNIEFCEKFLWH